MLATSSQMVRANGSCRRARKWGVRGTSRSPVLSLILLLVVITFSAQVAFAGEGLEPFSWPDLPGRLSTIVLTGLASFFAGVGLMLIKARRDPRHEISYDLETLTVSTSIDPSIQENIEILFDGKKLEKNLSLVRAEIVNTGNRAVKRIGIRFEFGVGCKVLQVGFRSEPRPEIGFVLPKNLTDAKNIRCEIGQLGPEEKISLQFSVTGAQVSQPKAHLDDADIALKLRNVSTLRDEVEHARVKAGWVFGFALSILIFGSAAAVFWVSAMDANLATLQAAAELVEIRADVWIEDVRADLKSILAEVAFNLERLDVSIDQKEEQLQLLETLNDFGRGLDGWLTRRVRPRG